MSNEKKITLSTIITVYNSAPYIKRCLDSILGQTRIPDEIVCIDDGSTDNSFGILKEYAENNCFIKLIMTENRGEVAAKKEALNVSKGNYISYIDSDDWIEPFMYDEMIEKVKLYDAEIVTSGLIRDYGKVQVDEKEYIEPGLYKGQQLKNIVVNNMIDNDVFFRKNIAFNVVNKIFKREILFDKQMEVPTDISVGEDISVSYPCIMDCKSIYITGKSYYHYCIRQDSVMGAMSADKYNSIEKMLRYMEQRYAKAEMDKVIAFRQFHFLNTYMRLFWRPQDILFYNGGFLNYYGYIKQNSKVIIYGAGGFGVSLKRFLNDNTDINIVAWVDKSAEREGVKKPDCLLRIEFDVILVAILISDIIKQVKQQLIEMGIDEGKIMTINPNECREDTFESLVLK